MPLTNTMPLSIRTAPVSTSMSLAATTLEADVRRRVLRIQSLTIAWMTVEAVVSLGAAWRARSPSLLAFGGDSAVELLSASAVIWRFRSAALKHRPNGLPPG